MFLTRTKLHLLPLQPPARLKHIFWEDLGEVSVNKIPKKHTWTYTVICTLEFAKYVSALPRGAAPIVHLIPNFLRVVFLNTEIIAPLSTTVWSKWSESDPRTNNVFLADFNTTGINGEVSRPSFSAELTSSEAAAFSIASAVGNDYENWVDASYIV